MQGEDHSQTRNQLRPSYSCCCRPTCLECSEQFCESYLLTSFDYDVCDGCKETSKDGKHELITKTDAVKEFLLKDYDFDRREPPLKFITRKNPHNQRWGMMKLYLRVQVRQHRGSSTILWF